MKPTVVPEFLLDELRTSAQRRAKSKMRSLLKVRDWLEENKHKIIFIGQAYKEFAEAMGYSKNTLERNVRIIRNYPSEKLLQWVHAGLSFDHLEMANFYQDETKPAAWLLDKAIDPGNAEGKVMTVDELILFANSEKRYTPILIRLKNLWQRIGDFPKALKWDTEKEQRFTVRLQEVWKEFFND